MDLLRRHWEKAVFVLSVLIFGYSAYGFYSSTKLSADNREMYQVREQIDSLLNDSADRSAAEVPDYLANAKQPWTRNINVSEGPDWAFHFPALFQPTKEEVEDPTKHVMPGPQGLSAESTVKKGVTLSWSYEKIQVREKLKRVAPTTVSVLRKKQGDQEWTTIKELESSGTGSQSFVDPDVKARTEYSYKVRAEVDPEQVVPEGNHVFEGEVRKGTGEVTVTTPSVLDLTFTGTAGDGAFITIKKFDRQQGKWRNKRVLVNPGNQIGQEFFQTPYTLKKVEKKMLPYWVLMEDRNVGAAGDVTWTAKMDIRETERSVMIYTDPEGNEKQLKKRKKLPNEYRKAKPWEKDKFDQFVALVPEGPQGNKVPCDRENIECKFKTEKEKKKEQEKEEGEGERGKGENGDESETSEGENSEGGE